MIISRWRGFEIDSSEGYYLYRKEPEHTEEGWNVMLRLLRSPLVLGKIAFSLEALPEKGKELRKRLKELLAEARLEEFLPNEDYVSLDYMAPIPVFLEIVESRRDSLSRVELNFCLKPFSEMPPEELQRLRSWFLQPGNAYKDEPAARQQWDKLAEINEKDLGLIGMTDNRHAEDISLAFEAHFRLDLGKPFWYEVSTSGVDASLVTYLFLTLVPGSDFKYISD